MNRKWILTVTSLLIVMMMLSMGFTSRALAVSGAVSTTDNPGYVGPDNYTNQACLNGQGTNCNIYLDKRDVWFSGLPVSAALGEGTYFFAVLSPGGQAAPNDGGTNQPNGELANLSDNYDTYANRTFTVDGNGNVTSYAGTHNLAGNLIQLYPYADTPNPGGVYILAVCSLDKGLPVNPSDCKYDAFKIKAEEGAEGPTITKDAYGAYDKTFAWTISKEVDQTLVKQSDVNATFKYTVKVTHDSGTVSSVKVTGMISVFNPNGVPVEITGVTDQLSDGTVCQVSGGSLTLNDFQTDFSYECDLSALPQSDLINTATVAWDAQTLSNGAELAAGSANFTFANISFAENKIDECVDVTDSYAGNLGQVCVGDANPTTFTYDRTVTGVAGTCTDYDNTAAFTTTDTGTTGSASQTVTLCVGKDLKVSKTAIPFFNRQYFWQLSKSVDKTFAKQVGGSVPFNYTVNVAETGFTDSNWYVNGTITVTNPNDWEDVTLTSLVDKVNNGGTCTLDEAGPYTVPQSGSLDVHYTCTYATQPTYTCATNTATATWDKVTYFTPNSGAYGQACFTFDKPTTTINKTVTVTDTFNGTTTTLGSVTAVDTIPYTSKTFTYTNNAPVPAFGCTSYPNTAKIVETGQTASTTVTVCGPVKTGALTMGFWQNNNGQGIIKNAGVISGTTTCKLTPFLRQYAPFQDLSATASCSADATYVYNVIKAANASGAAMNAMLKAQMLSTSLDVFFSNPALGGNKINAPAPIGGVTIDLTKVKKATGIYENVSAAFGGATQMTVSQMLTFAASKSNAGGSAWYGQVKATQELAKDAFDAINNQWAFAP